jgi:hypothetical protein
MADQLPLDRFDTAPQPLTIQYAKRSVVMLTVTKDELESVSGLGGSLYLAFFGICLGALVSFSIVLSTTSIASPFAFAAYVALTAISAIGTLLFGVKSIQEYRACRRRLKQLTQE